MVLEMECFENVLFWKSFGLKMKVFEDSGERLV